MGGLEKGAARSLVESIDRVRSGKVADGDPSGNLQS